MALALTEGHKVSRKQNLLGSFFKHLSAVVAEYFDAAVEYGLCKQEKYCLCIGNPYHWYAIKWKTLTLVCVQTFMEGSSSNLAWFIIL